MTLRSSTPRPGRATWARPLTGVLSGVLSGLLAAVLGALALATATPSRAAATGSAEAGVRAHVLRYGFLVAESSFDPAAVSDVYSRIIIGHIFEGLYAYDPLARPARAKPLVAAALPEHSEDWRTWTVKIRPGVFFQDDPAFGGKPRELVAEDFIYAVKRFADPAVRSPSWGVIEQIGIQGLREAREAALASGRPFNYDKPLPGLRALDRHTLRFELAAPRPRFLYSITGNEVLVPMAREVVEAAGENVGAHPVGTGPFRLAEWRRASRIVLERNPGYRERVYDAEPLPDDAEGQALLARFRGRRLPMLDRVEVSVIEQPQPRWLSFLNGEADFIERVPAEFIDMAVPGGQIAPNLRKKGIRAARALGTDVGMTMFNFDDPVVGSDRPEAVALRRAIALGWDLDREIRIQRHGQMIPGQSIVTPGTYGYDPQLRTGMDEFNLPKARALLDLYGWRDRDGDGWREQPDGSPLTLEYATQDDSTSHQAAELWQRTFKQLGLRVTFKIATWPENLKNARNGKLQMWSFGSTATAPDGQEQLERLYGKAAGGNNTCRWRNAQFDAVYERLLALPDGPERLAGFTEAKRLATAYMPYKIHGHRIVTDLIAPQLQGYRRPAFGNNWWQYVDVEPVGAR